MEFWLPNTAALCLPNQSMGLYHPKKLLLPPDSIRHCRHLTETDKPGADSPPWGKLEVWNTCMMFSSGQTPSLVTKNFEYFLWNKICIFSWINTSCSLMFHLKLWTKYPSYKSPHTEHASLGDEKALLKPQKSQLLADIALNILQPPHKLMYKDTSLMSQCTSR